MNLEVRRRLEILVALMVGVVGISVVIWVGLRPGGRCAADNFYGRLIHPREDDTTMNMRRKLHPPGRSDHPQVNAALEKLSGCSVRLTLTNTSRSTAYLERSNLPSSSRLENDAFVVGNGDERAEYKGRFYKRPPPEPEDFDELGPAQSRSYEIDLSKYYEMSDPSRHRIWYEAFHGKPNDSKALWLVVSNEVVVW